MAEETDASKQIDERIKELGDWRGETLANVRRIIKEAAARRRRGVEVGEGHEPRNAGLVSQRGHLYR